ncbi:MAG: hypothetical protein KatS3mg030_660 [Saprospiraceae bacterium]|nr:MAG: hypothetical protein KatS3mg029_0219 [Saprospiraceae bacterium]GIV32358.1 MAG: hypothetical protein KatS3mg030_660 [Saprospiraceae bacterium]
MEMQILVSKKGTRVVLASELYVALELPKQDYGRTVRKWIQDCYEFRDGIRKPESLRDFALKKKGETLVEDYYLSLELAKCIALHSRSKRKMVVARWLAEADHKEAHADLFSLEQIKALVELARVMGLVSCQMACEQRHHQVYQRRNGGKKVNWWNFRSAVLGYSTADLRAALERAGKKVAGKSQRELLMHLDKYEMIRAAVIDLFMAMGKREELARNAGELAKFFARELKVEIFDDRNSLPGLVPEVNPELVEQVKNGRVEQPIQLWENRKVAC